MTYKTVKIAIVCVGISFFANTLTIAQQKSTKNQEHKRLIVIMFDGFGMNYFNNAPMPFLQNAIKEHGFMKQVNAIMPTVTNANNASICTGTFPEQNGIVGNSFYNYETGVEEYMENATLLKAPTLFERLRPYGIKSALIASKKKSIYLLPKGAEIVVSPEKADSSWIAKIGKTPEIYSCDINYWTMDAALYILNFRKDIHCLYIHPTDFPMHMWAPGDSNETTYLTTMDNYIKKLHKAAPDAIICITADHDINHKDRCVDLEKSLALQNVSIKMAISVEKDKYPKHHSGYGGVSYVYLNKPDDLKSVNDALLKIKGVKSVYTKQEAASKFHLLESRLGDLVVTSDSMSVFGILETPDKQLPNEYRTHGSEYELSVPLIILYGNDLPKPEYFQYNKDLIAWIFEKNYLPLIDSLK